MLAGSKAVPCVRWQPADCSWVPDTLALQWPLTMVRLQAVRSHGLVTQQQPVSWQLRPHEVSKPATALFPGCA